MENFKENNYNKEVNAESGSSGSVSSFTTKQKVAIVFLGIFFISFIALWANQFNKNINSPFADKTDNKNAAINLDDKEDSEGSLRLKDTDKDGLSDWDELYFYKTSPYLEDSDSDGFSDSEEIKTDNDPNCPAGRVCDSGILSTDTVDSQNTSAVNNDILNSLGGAVEQPSGSTIDGSNINASELRQMLIDEGMSQEALSAISDADLLRSFQEALQSEAANGGQ